PLGGRLGSGLSDLILEERDVRWASVTFQLFCSPLHGESACGLSRSSLTIDHATFTLSDQIAPSVGTGSNHGNPRRGIIDLPVIAQDAGSGLYRSVLEIDGVEIDRRIIDSNDGRCGDVESGNFDPYEFATPAPCVNQFDGEIPLDTRAFRDGSHA